MKREFLVPTRHYDKGTATSWGDVHLLPTKARTAKEAKAKVNGIVDSIVVTDQPIIEYKEPA